MSQVYRVGIIGYGFSGKHIHANLINNTQGLSLAAVCDRHATAGQRETYRVVNDAESIIQAPDIDLVVIATPNQLHFPLAKQALEAGKNVVIDKPFTVSVAESLALAELAKQKNNLLCAFQNRRFDSDFLTVSQLIKEAAVGEIRYFESNYTFFRPEVDAGWRENHAPGSGVWFDLGAHLVDQMVNLFGQPLSGNVTLGQHRVGAKTTDFFHATYNYASLHVSLRGSLFGAPQQPRFLIDGTKGSYIKTGQDPQEDALIAGLVPTSPGWGIDPQPGKIITGSEQQQSEAIYPSVVGRYGAFYAAVYLAMLGEAPSPVALNETLTTVQLIEKTPQATKIDFL
ncbi:oxidoreductase [Pantoea sp. A4]|uniref:oxidoreductase n=1 Tax=Pantoea sp. A4 TaxID=1225184 RepID=UPI00037F057F|nr:oxidoreductase [Pantoea sp. A4]